MSLIKIVAKRIVSKFKDGKQQNNEISVVKSQWLNNKKQWAIVYPYAVLRP